MVKIKKIKIFEQQTKIFNRRVNWIEKSFNKRKNKSKTLIEDGIEGQKNKQKDQEKNQKSKE